MAPPAPQSSFPSFSKQEPSGVALYLPLCILLGSGSKISFRPPALWFRALQGPRSPSLLRGGMELEFLVYCAPWTSLQAGPSSLMTWWPPRGCLTLPRAGTFQSISWLLASASCTFSEHLLDGILLWVWKHFPSSLLFLPAMDHISLTVLNFWKLDFYTDCLCVLPSYLYFMPLHTGQKQNKTRTNLCFGSGSLHFPVFFFLPGWALSPSYALKAGVPRYYVVECLTDLIQFLYFNKYPRNNDSSICIPTQSLCRALITRSHGLWQLPLACSWTCYLLFFWTLHIVSAKRPLLLPSP